MSPEDVQKCLEGMGLDFSKCNKFEAEQHRKQYLNTLTTIEDV